MDAEETLGVWLKRRRRMLDLTQKELAQQVSCSVVTVRKLEANDLRPSKDLAQRLAKCLEIEPDKISAFVTFARAAPKSASTVATSVAPISSKETWSPSATPSKVSQHSILTKSTDPTNTVKVDWGEAPDVRIFHGRHTELTCLNKWIVTDGCRLIGVLGMSGIGKTTLTAKLALQVQQHFHYVIWRSLRNAPPLETILQQFVQILSNQEIYQLPPDIDSQIALLIEYLRQAPCLLILDNMETILQEGEHQGDYLAGYRAYDQLIQRVGESTHQSCLLLTSREKPLGFGRLEGVTSPVRAFQLTNLTTDAGQLLPQNKGLSGSDNSWIALIEHYSGNPLALQVVAEAIRELFNGNIDDFLQEDVFIFGGIRTLLAQHFERLSEREQAVIFWLAIEREPVSIPILQEDMVPSVSRQALLETLQSLSRRSLLEKSEEGFTLQYVVMEYVTDRLIEQVEQEIMTESIALFQSHALIKAQSKDYVRESQTYLILQPIAARLVARLGQAELDVKAEDASVCPTSQCSYGAGICRWE
ncbi:helix-turn-helix domain-containing protein [Chloroflexi bacterium TSY]|nr:helix-turn-helix domain-containing protein [Chloroflexi bacterium TSY]